MPRYTKQRDNFRCGPVAILNAMRWAGDKVPYDRVKSLQKSCRCRFPIGTTHGHFDRTLRQAGEKSGFKVRRVDGPYLWYMENHVKRGGAIILSYRWRDGTRAARHFALLTGVNQRGTIFSIVNDSKRGPALCRVSRKTLVRHNLQFQRVDPHFRAWFLTKT